MKELIMTIKEFDLCMEEGEKWRRELLKDLRRNGPMVIRKIPGREYPGHQIVSMLEYLQVLGNIRIEIKNRKGNPVKNQERYTLHELPNRYKAVIFYGRERRFINTKKR
jgi:Holliday junction resolvase